MDPTQQKQDLLVFTALLPEPVQIALTDKNIDILVDVSDAGNQNGFTVGEMGNIYEGVRKVLSGEDTPQNFLASVQNDPRIESDNRSKVPRVVELIRQKIFVPVLPIMKEAGYKVTLASTTPTPGSAVPVAPTPPPSSAQGYGRAQLYPPPLG